jgi:hypothetical protein
VIDAVMISLGVNQGTAKPMHSQANQGNGLQREHFAALPLLLLPVDLLLTQSSRRGYCMCS